MSTDTRRRDERATDPTRKAALAGGILYIITFLSSIPAVFLLGPLLDDPTYVIGAGADLRIGLGATLDMVNAITCVGTAVALFSVLKREHESLALGFVATRLIEAAVISIGVVSLLGVVTLRGGDIATSDPASAVAIGTALVAVRDWTFLLGPCLMASLNALMFASVLYRARLVPRAIPALGLVGAPVMITFVVATMLGLSELGSTFNTIAGAPFFFWELAAGLWMIFKGFDRRSPVVAAAIAEARSTGHATVPVTAGAAIATKAGAA